MNANDRNERLRSRMQPSPFVSGRFTEEMAQAVSRRIHSQSAGRGGEAWRRPRRAILAAVLTAVCLAAVWGLPSPLPGHRGQGGLTESHAYFEQGKQLFAIYPEPDARAGIMQGYVFSFTAPFRVFEGKNLRVEAVHAESGWRETAYSGLIRSPDSGYEGLERHGMQFVLPLGGLWRLDVLLDGVSYGHVTIALHEPDWQASPEFRSGAYLMRGVEGKVAFIDAGFSAGMHQKYMWHFWGDKEKFDGGFQVKAIKEGEERPVDVFSTDSFFSGSLNGADLSAVSMMSLPEPGRWRLLPTRTAGFWNAIVVDVKQAGKE